MREPGGELTGESVKRFRLAYGYSRPKFVEACGDMTYGRLTGIETKESWLPGDRTKVLNGVRYIHEKFGQTRNGLMIEAALRIALTHDGVPNPLDYLDDWLPDEHDPLLGEDWNGHDDADPLPILEEDDDDRLNPSWTQWTRSMAEPEEDFILQDAEDDIEVVLVDDIELVPADEQDYELESLVDTDFYEEDEPTKVLEAFDSNEKGVTAPPADEPDYVFSNSEHQSWKRCRRQWWLRWYRKLTLKETDFYGPRAVGDRVHRALQMWYVADSTQRVDPRDALERVIVEDWTLLRGQLQYDDDEAVARLAAKFEDATMLERAMVEGYVQWLAETGQDSNFVVVGSEQVLHADFPGGDSGLPTIRVVGRLDARVLRITDGARMFLDHKTVADMKSPQGMLGLNEQMLEYLLLEWLNTADGEARCDGALYNMLRRVKRTARAQPPFYERVEVRHNESELESFRTRLLAAAYDVDAATIALNNGLDPLRIVYPSPRKDCTWDCEFLPVCRMFDDKHSYVEEAIQAIYKTADPRARYDEQDG